MGGLIVYQVTHRSDQPIVHIYSKPYNIKRMKKKRTANATTTRENRNGSYSQ